MVLYVVWPCGVNYSKKRNPLIFVKHQSLSVLSVFYPPDSPHASVAEYAQSCLRCRDTDKERYSKRRILGDQLKFPSSDASCIFLHFEIDTTRKLYWTWCKLKTIFPSPEVDRAITVVPPNNRI